MTILLAIALMVVALILVRQNHIKKELEQAYSESQQRFKITYDLLWMQVRDKNDLTYTDMGNLIVSMQKSDLMPAVRETLAKRITGEGNTPKRIGF